MTATRNRTLEWFMSERSRKVIDLAKEPPENRTPDGAGRHPVDRMQVGSLLTTPSRVRIHNQNMTTAAKGHADKKTFGHLS